MDIQSPVLERFVNLIVTLHKPSLIKESAYINESLLAEMALVYEVTSEKDARVFELLND